MNIQTKNSKNQINPPSNEPKNNININKIRTTISKKNPQTKKRTLKDLKSNKPLDSFYQLSSFINLFCSQLKIFSNQKTYYTIHINNLKELKLFPKEMLNQIRPLIIESLKNNSNIVGRSAFHSFLKRQNEALELSNKDNNKIEENIEELKDKNEMEDLHKKKEIDMFKS